MKTIKVIDLLNMISKGEEVPKKIKYKNVFLKYRNDIKDYGGDRYFLTELISIENIGLILNDKVEILEEEKKIPEKLNLDTDELRGKETPRAIDYLIESKINQVINYLETKEKGE